MNLLLFDKKELSGNRLRLPANDRRALHISNILKLKPEDTVRVGMINGKMGEGYIISANEECIEIEFTLTNAAPQDSRDLTLILAMPRPIMLQRILKQATVMGVKTFHLIRSEKVQKSYFQSNLLQDENIRELLLQGLEQAIDTRMPEVYIHKRFKPFVEDVVPVLKSKSLLLAHPDTKFTLPGLYKTGGLNKDFALAIGPEGGWNSYEVGLFLDQGFTAFSFGSRILHVDTAVLVLLSQLMVLQDLSDS